MGKILEQHNKKLYLLIDMDLLKKVSGYFFVNSKENFIPALSKESKPNYYNFSKKNNNKLLGKSYIVSAKKGDNGFKFSQLDEKNDFGPSRIEC